MPCPTAALCFLLLAALPQSAAAAQSAAPPLARTLTLDLWGASLEDAAREIQAQTGVGVVFYRPELPGLGVADRVYLLTGRVPLRTVLECLAWRFSLRYRVAASGRIEISRGYGWAGGELQLKILRLEDVTPPAGGAEAMRALLSEFVRPLPLLPEGPSLVVDAYPTPAHPAGLRATAALPAVMADYLARGLACLAGAPGDAPSAPSPESTSFAAGTAAPPDWPAFLSQTVPAVQAPDLRSALRSITQASSSAIILFGSPAGVAGTADLPAAGLGVMTEVLSRRFGLGHRVFLSGRAVGFRGTGSGSDVDPALREIFWDGLAVSGFDARGPAERLGGGPSLTRYLRRTVRPWLWRDGLCALVYSPVTGRLAVVAPAPAVQDIATRLRELSGGSGGGGPGPGDPSR